MNIDNKSSIDDIKEKLNCIYKTTDIIHVSVNQKRKKINAVEAKITGLYTNFITVIGNVNGYIEDFTITYIDIMLGNTNIIELN